MADFNISMDYLEEIASKIDLSKDLSKAKVTDLNSIGEAVFFKLTHHERDITEFIEDTQHEIKSYLSNLLKRRGIKKQEESQILQFLGGDSLESENALLSIEVLKK